MEILFVMNIVLFFGAGLTIAIFGTLYNVVLRSKYKKLMDYLHDQHPMIYEKVRVKSVGGVLYPPGVYRESLKYAKNHPPTNDPIAEELFAEYVEYSQISPSVMRRIVYDALKGNLDLGYDKNDALTGAAVGIFIGAIVGALTMQNYYPELETNGLIIGAITGSFAGILGGAFLAVYEIRFDLPPLVRSILGAGLAAWSWVGLVGQIIEFKF